ncbi:MAG: hypothetical protein KDB53_17045, partial [Planctomycetes bacterium]|nr:hypothetical protein [Planctomycetota bacterium]
MRHPHDTREFRRQARLASRELIRIRPIQTRDDPGMAGVIRAVMTEMKACAKGFAIHDPEVEHMSRAYADDRSRFWVVVRGDEERVVGGAGFAPLEGGPADTCELR